MNREEEITKASLDFSPCFEYRREIFIKGAKWADEHPANFWHKNIDGDLPKKSGCYLVMAQNGFCHTCKYDTGSRYWDTIGYQSDIAYWMEIPKLPK